MINYRVLSKAKYFALEAEEGWQITYYNLPFKPGCVGIYRSNQKGMSGGTVYVLDEIADEYFTEAFQELKLGPEL
jgi:hypothetical protein